ncbi:MAG: tRNA (adenosine(37)-N6)-threonylcarbamoyltransferase complex dimerization subunit type 1 TsaB [Candidatus Auribacterota bacterium]|nr:tRNA (adenosine(37)-N6)-threonylcarbamoyltransferase complex dimerization subunit type 1 TsaB [Candidatus Auribacterota bacterium]
MKILSIETTSDRASVAYLEQDKILAEAVIEERLIAKDTLLANVRKVLSAGGASLNDINLVVCGVGPGSFTGIRLGIAFIKGIVTGIEKLETCGVISNDSIGFSCVSEEYSSSKNIMSIVDSKTGRSYVRKYSSRGEPLGEINLLPNEEIKRESTGFYPVGIFSKKLENTFAEKRIIWPDAGVSGKMAFKGMGNINIKPYISIISQLISIAIELIVKSQVAR